MLLRYLKSVKLEKATTTKRENGTPQYLFSDVKMFRVQEQILDDEVSASIYGANLYKMIRIKSVRNGLENYLYTKINNKEDNISNYYINIDNKRYKIKAVNPKGIDLELTVISNTEVSL